jgi:hypothetical protein
LNPSLKHTNQRQQSTPLDNHHHRNLHFSVAQLLGFGVEKHDEAVVALVYLVLGIAGDGIEEQKVHHV